MYKYIYMYTYICMYIYICAYVKTYDESFELYRQAAVQTC